jgi:hypothetical protein
MTPEQIEFATAVATAITSWGELDEWQKKAITCIAPVLAVRLIEADDAIDLLDSPVIDDNSPIFPYEDTDDQTS